VNLLSATFLVVHLQTPEIILVNSLSSCLVVIEPLGLVTMVVLSLPCIDLRWPVSNTKKRLVPPPVLHTKGPQVMSNF
jgi:hypothetical protein